MKLNEIKDNPGARKLRVRVGRGTGSGVGKTCGRGHKGQKSRSGVAIKGFEGGQMPLHMRLPKRGFNNYNRKSYAQINLATLQDAVESGKIQMGSELDGQALKDAGVITHVRDGVRLLGKGELKAKLSLRLAGVSASARAAVEKVGGSIEIPVKKTQVKAKQKASSKQK